MSTHQATGPHAIGSRAIARDPNHALNVRVLRFRHSPHREDPSLLAHELLERGRHEDALELLEMALSREPGDADLELLRGRALIGAGDLPSAKETLIRAARAAPGWAAPLTWLSRALSIGEGSSARAGAIARRARTLGAVSHPETFAKTAGGSRRRRVAGRGARVLGAVEMAPRVGLEPTTICLEGRRSIP